MIETSSLCHSKGHKDLLLNAVFADSELWLGGPHLRGYNIVYLLLEVAIVRCGHKPLYFTWSHGDNDWLTFMFMWLDVVR